MLPKKYLITHANIVNEGACRPGSVLINNDIIEEIFTDAMPVPLLHDAVVIDANDAYLLPGIIDTHVHFREPGMTNKGDMLSESRAAVAGGITSVMEMPNTIPQTTTLYNLENKNKIASEKCLCNYAFFLGGTNNNIEEIKNADLNTVCGLKIFMGASTGEMLVDNDQILDNIFKNCNLPIAVHCENSAIIGANLEAARQKYGNSIPSFAHTEIRSIDACVDSTRKAVALAKKYRKNTHILHISTAEEVKLLASCPDFISAETAPHYLLFTNSDFNTLGNLIKCNPSIKYNTDRDELIKALKNNYIDTIATDHAPHEFSVKNTSYPEAASGMPGIQFSLPATFDLFTKHNLSINFLVEKMCHNPARIFSIERRGFIKKGYFADLVIFDPEKETDVDKTNIYSKCGWTPYKNMIFKGQVKTTFINGKIVFHNHEISDALYSKPLRFNR